MVLVRLDDTIKKGRTFLEYLYTLEVKSKLSRLILTNKGYLVSWLVLCGYLIDI